MKIASCTFTKANTPCAEFSSLLGHYAMSVLLVPTFRIIVALLASESSRPGLFSLKVQIFWQSETSVIPYQSAKCSVSGNLKLKQHFCENHTSETFCSYK